MTGQVGKDETIYLVDNFGLYSECCASILEKELGYTNVNVISGTYSPHFPTIFQIHVIFLFNLNFKGGISSWNSCGGPGLKSPLKIQNNKGSKNLNRS
jgi:hypothetical protein